MLCASAVFFFSEVYLTREKLTNAVKYLNINIEHRMVV